jgi:hypothetical protein
MARTRPVVLGLVVVVLVGAVAFALRFWPQASSLRYVADGAPFAVMVSLRPTTPSADVPESVTVELPTGERIIARRLKQ